MIETVFFLIAALVTFLVLIGFFLVGYYVGLGNAVEMSKTEPGDVDNPLFASDKPYGWDLTPDDIDSIESWEEFEERIDE